MQSSSALLFRPLTSKIIHPQLPLSPRESQQLLQLLTSSFQRHLDRNHPTSASEVEVEASSHTNDPPISTSRKAPIQYSSRHLANHHLNTLLNNPLFSTKPTKHSVLNKAPQDTLKSQEDPLRWLRSQFASGSGSLNSVHTCLRQIWAKTDPQSYILEHHVASRIFEWTETSSSVHRIQLCASDIVRRYLCKALIAEKKAELIWDWASLKSMPDTLKRRLLGTYAKAVTEDSQPRSLDPAIDVVLTAISRGFRPVDVANAMHMIIQNALAGRDELQMSPGYHMRLSLALPQCSVRPRFDAAVLGLFHPTNPTTKEAVVYFQNFCTEKGKSANRTQRHSRALVSLFLSLARRLFEEENFTLASTVLNVVKEDFPEELGLDPRDPKAWPRDARGKDEAESLHHLKGLSLV